MPFFSLFIIAAILLGTGAMLSPVWASSEPRIGLAASFALAIIVGGAVWWAELFGWDTLVIDYLLFALVSVVILGGTMSQGQGGNESAWISRVDLAFFIVVAVICAMPLFVLNLPLGTHAASDALITLAAREGGSFTSLAPFYPEVTGFAPPGFFALAAYLSQQLHQPIPTIHMAIGAVTAFLTIWTAFDLGSEIQDKRLGRAMALAALASLGVLNLLWQSYYSQLMGVLFAFAFITYALRYYRQHKLLDMVAAGLLLGAIAYVSPILFVVTAFSFYLWLIILHLLLRRQPSKEIHQWTTTSRLGLWFGIALVCAFGIGVWVVKNQLSLCSIIDCMNYNLLTSGDGFWHVSFYTLISTFLAGYVFLWLYEKLPSNLQELNLKFIYGIFAIALLVGIGAIIYLKGNITQAATENDLAAMTWIGEYTAEDALILNYPYSLMRDERQANFLATYWLVSYANRESVYISAHSCSIENNGYCIVVHPFWMSPTALQSQAILLADSVNYVLIPDSLDFPQEIESLQLVFEQGGARVYEVIHEE